MRLSFVVLIALGAVACRTRIQRENDSEVYGGLGISALPDVGVTVVAGQYFYRSNPKFDLAFEMRATRQGGNDSASQSGKFFQIQAGVKQVMSPGHDRRLFFRYGATWLRATGNPNIFNVPGDYLGVFAAAGYEWDLTERLILSPEISVNAIDGEGGIGFEVLPQAMVSLLFRF